MSNDKTILDYKIIECADKICIDRSLIVFEKIINLIKKFDIKNEKDIYIFHHKGNACTKKNFPYKLLSSSRKIGYNNIILWPTIFLCESNIIKTPYYHHDATYFMSNYFIDEIWENKKPIFFFRGINSGNPFPSVKLSWNLERESRTKLFFEHLKLSDECKKMCDISFDRLYPNSETLNKIITNEVEYKSIAMQENWILNKDKTIDDLKKEIKILMENTKKHITLTEIFQHKFLFCLEGFDVSSILNIVLCSNSLAIMPKMYYENTIINSSYLKPYVHYVPIKEDFSNLEEVMKWCLNNDDKCKEIIKNANEYSKIFLNENKMLALLCNLIKKF